MANTSFIRGLIPIGTLRGGLAPRVRTYFVPASDGTALFIGDPVTSAAGADTAGQYETVTAATASQALIGVVVGVDPIKGVASTANLNLNISHRPASTALYVRVCDDPDAIFESQEDGVGGTISAANASKNVDIIVAAGSTTSGLSGTMIDSSTVATTATLPLKLLGIVNKPANALGASCKWRVKINNHQLASSTGTAGV